MPSREDILANITTGPGRPSRGDILANMTGGAQGPLIDLVRAPKDVPQRTPVTTGQLLPRPEPVRIPEAPEPEPGPFEFAGPLGKFIDLIDTPRAAIVSTIKEVGDLFTGEGFSPVDWWKQTEDNLFMQDVMRDWGLDLPGPLDMVLGLGLDIAFDPITYMTGGIGAAGRAGMTAPKLINVMSKGAAWYDDIVKAGGKAGVTATQAAHKSKVLKDGVNAVGRSNAMHSAGREALQEVGLLGQMGLFVPTTGRLGRAVRLDKVLDKATRGGVTARRASQASKLPYIGELARPVAQGALDDAAEAVARFGAAGAQDAAAAEARIVGRMKDIAKGVDLGDMPDDFYTAAARVASRMPVEGLKLPGFTGKVLTTVVPQFGKAKANLFSRETAKNKAKAGPFSRGIAETIENSFNTKAGLKRGLRSGDYETVLDANRIMVGNNAGWAARNRFMDLMSKDALDLRRSARRLGLEPKQVDDMLKTQYYLTDSLGATVVENGLPVMNPAFQQKFGAVIERAGLSVVADFWTQGRHWMDNALLRANAFGGMNWLASSADELWVMRRALEQAYDPTMQRQLIAGGEFRGIPLMKQADDPLRRTVDEQIKAIAKAEFGDGAEELFDTNIWKAMDVYLSKIGEGVRRSKIMTLLEEGGIAFQEPLTWIKGQKDVAHNALKKQYGARGDLFDEVFRGIEAGLDVEQVKAMRMKIAKREGASKMGEQAAAWVAETEILEAKLVDIQSRLIEAMGDVTRRGRQSKESMHEFMKPLLEEASLIGYRKAQLEAVSRMLMGQQTAATRTITDEKLLAELTEAFAAAAEKMRHLVEDAKSLAEVSTDVQSMKRLLAALQEPLAELDKQGLLDAFPEVPRMREWFGDVFEFRELLNPTDPPGPWAKTVPAPGFDVREVYLDDRLYPDIGSIYRDYNGISVNDLPRWMGEAKNSWEEVTAAYRGALDRGHGYGASLDEWQQRQALAGGVLLSKDSPFVRLEATLRDGVWSRNVSGGAEVAEGQPLKWSKAPSEEVPFASRPLREPKYSIPTEKELLIKYRSVTNVDEATGMTLEERQALRLREAKEWTDAGKHVGSKPRTTLPGETAMSVREVDGRRQIDVWTIEPSMAGWRISVNGEEVASARSLKQAKELAQAEATKRLGVAPTAREVAAEAVTPPPAAAGGVPAELRVISWETDGPAQVLAYNAEAGRALVIPSWRSGADFGNPKQNVFIVKLHEGTTFADPRYEGRIEHYSGGRSKGTRQVWRDRGFTFADEAAEAAEVSLHENDRVREVKGWVQAYERTLPESKVWNQTRHDVADDVESFLAGTEHGWLPTPDVPRGGRKVGEYGRLGASEEEVLTFVEAIYPLGKGVGHQGDYGAPLHWPVKKPWDAVGQRKYAKKLKKYMRDMFVSHVESGVARMADEAAAEAASAVAARRAVARRKVFSACTGPKCELAEGATVAAEDLYTGEPFKYLKRQIEGSDAELGGIISAKHGVLDPTELVGSYDVKLPKAADALYRGAKEVVAGPEQLRKFADLVGGAEELFFYGSAAYRKLMKDLLKRAQARGLVGEHVRVVEPTGTAAGGGPKGIGEMKQSLGKWAGEGVPAPTAREVAAEAVTPPPAAADLGPLTPDEVRLQVDITSEVEGTVEGAYDIYLLTHKSGARVREVGLGDFVYLDDLFVPEAHRGRGIARGMMMDLIDMHTPVLAHDSARGVYLHSQDELLPFYRSLGFELAPKDDPGWRLAGDDQNLMWFHARGEAAPGLTRIGDEVAAEAVTPPAGGPVWRDLAGYKKGDAYELVADLNASEGAMLVSRPGVGESEPTMFRIRRSKGKAGGWSVWYKQEGFEKFEKVAGGGNVRVPAKSNPDKTVAVPGVWETLEDAKAHVDSLVGDAPTARVVAAEAVTPPAAAAAAESVPISFFDDMREVGMPDPRLDPDTPRFGDVATDNVEGFATWEDFVEDIRQRGIRNPIRVGKDSTTGELVGLDGNHRLQAARQLGMDEVPVVVEERAVTELAAAPTSPPVAATRAPDPSGMYGPKGAPRFDEAIVRTPFGDFRLRFVGKRTGQGVEILDAPSGLMASPAKTGEKVPGTRAPLGPGVKFKNYAAAESRIDGWAQEVFENRWTGAEAQGAVGATFLDPARQGGVRQALATLTGRTETTGFPGGIEEGLSWLDEPMWRMPLERRMAFTEAERDVLIQAERLNHLAYALADYEKAEAAMRVGLTVEAEIATMQGRLRQLQGEQDMATAVYEAAGANLREPGGRKDLAHQGLAPKDVAELFDGTRTDMDYFQAALRKFNTSRGKDLFDKSLTQQTAAQWGPNSVDPKWSRGWSAPLGDGGGEAAPVFEMLNALFKTSSSSGDFGAFLKWYDKFLNYWKAQAVSTPGFVIRNGLGGSWLSYAFGLMELGSTNKFAGVFFKASKLGEGNAVKGVDKMIAALGVSKKKSVSVGFGSRVDINELRTIRRVLDSGIVGGGQVITEVDRNVAMRLVRESRNPITNQPIDVVFNPASTEFAPFRFIRSSNEQMETVLRGALAFDVLQKGGSVADAAGQVYKFHFNYADLTSMERKMRRIIPFWTWQKNVVPILVESLGKHPYAWGRLQQVKGNLELQSKEEGVVPDYFLENMAIRLPWKINDYQSYWIPDLPFRDLNRLMKEPGSITRVFAESAAPPVKVPLEIWAGKQFFADLPFSGRYQQVPHVYAKFPFLMDALSLAGKAKKDKKGEYKMRDQDLYMMDSWMPFLSRFRRLLPNESRYSRRVASTVVSTVFGTQVRVNDPHETRNQIIRNDRAFDEKMRDLIDIEMRVR